MEISTYKNYLNKLCDKQNLSFEEIKDIASDIFTGKMSDAKMAAILIALRSKGETAEEIAGFAQIMRDNALHLNPPYDVLDIVGTGGDLVGTINISTISSLIIAASGVKIAKHGGRSVSSKCGSVDVLEALGVKIEQTPKNCQRLLDKIDICFMWANCFHPAFGYTLGVRKELGVKTVFNILGPLTNPANATKIILGVYDEKLIDLVANVLIKLGVKKAIVVHGCDGLDEITICDETIVAEITNNKINKYKISPEQFGLKRYPQADILGGTPEENQQIVLDVLDNKISGAKKDIVLLNSGVAIYMCDKAKSIEEGIAIAKKTLESGKAREKLQQFVVESNKEV
ncbi:MAG: anthranilate phosphoribosyltransferase [Mycoplasmataceae bacterium]|nr:anthranilate phosphoribosyltransferase [Mycoplasmataceae bacterium]